MSERGRLMTTFPTYHEQGYEAGKAAGSWIIDGNTDAATARRILDGYEEGDPEVMDMQPSPLSGEWAGESLAELGLDQAEDWDLDEYENGYSVGYWAEVIRSAQALLG